MHHASIVFTSINNPALLEDYYENFKKYGRLSDVDVIMIPDRKTPKSAYDTCDALSRKGLQVSCVTLEDQESFLKKVGFPSNMIPYNSDNRRNVGYLMAFERRSDFIISIDDDNYSRMEDDFLAEHSAVMLDDATVEEVDSPNRWFNICELLELDPLGASTYARGFPYYARRASELPSQQRKKSDIYVNAGLWLGDPDVDGISWMVNPVHASGWKGESRTLAKSTWTPINTQNTAMRRDAVAAYYYLKMGYRFGGGAIDRYGDIFSGYFLEACTKHLGHGIRVGSPCANHIRNSHNYLKDAQQELYCIVINEDILRWLQDLELDGGSYAESFVSLSYQLEDAVESFTSYAWDDSVRAYFHQMAHYMRAWIKSCRAIGE